MKQHPGPEDVDVDRADDQIVDEVPRRESKDQSASAGVSVYSFLGGHGFALVI